MEVKKVYILLRSEIIKTIKGVENSKSYLYWDNTIPNYVTKSSLQKMYSKYLAEFSNYGFFIINRHCDCDNKKHYEVNKDGYVMEKINENHLEYHDKNYIWRSPIDQFKTISACPCSENNKKTEHYIVQDIIFDPRFEIKRCEQIETIVTDIYAAIKSSEDNKPRSSIREYLLRAVINLNDYILPKPVQEYIEDIF